MDCSYILFVFCMCSLVLVPAYSSGTRKDEENKQEKESKRFEVSAYDFHRRTKFYLYPGACMPTTKLVQTVWITKPCNSRLNKKRFFHEYKTEKTNTIEVFSADDLFEAFGLCDGVSASVFGVLDHGDCGMVTIAKSIPFTDKSYTFVFYLKSTLGLEYIRLKDRKSEDPAKYVADVMYGVLEIITVTMTFNSTKSLQAIKELGLRNSTVSVQYDALVRHSEGSLREVKVNVYSSSEAIIFSRTFYRPHLPLVSEYVYVREDYINKLKEKLKANKRPIPVQYQLSYGLGGVYGQMGKDKLWRDASNLEAGLVSSVRQAKNQYGYFCEKGRILTKCRRLDKHIKRAFSKTKKLLHAGRSRWYLMEPSSKRKFLASMRKKVAWTEKKLRKTLKKVEGAAERVERIKRVKGKGGKKRKNRRTKKGRGKKQQNRARGKKNRRKKQDKYKITGENKKKINERTPIKEAIKVVKEEKLFPLAP